MIARLTEGLSARALALLVLLFAAALAAPLFASDYLLTVLILIFYFAYTGQAWNIMMGFAGQLSLGHALYVGLGAYAAAALFVHFGIGPWLGLMVAAPLAALAGAFVGYLAFRFRVGGVYFAILTIAVAEFARVGFDHLAWTNGSSGLFLPVKQYAHNDLWLLRGQPVMFYYILLAATVAALLVLGVAEAVLLADRIVVLSKGRVVADGKAADLLAHTTDPDVRALLEAPKRQAERLSAKLAGTA